MKLNVNINLFAQNWDMKASLWGRTDGNIFLFACRKTKATSFSLKVWLWERSGGVLVTVLAVSKYFILIHSYLSSLNSVNTWESNRRSHVRASNISVIDEWSHPNNTSQQCAWTITVTLTSPKATPFSFFQIGSETFVALMSYTFERTDYPHMLSGL